MVQDVIHTLRLLFQIDVVDMDLLQSNYISIVR